MIYNNKLIFIHFQLGITFLADNDPRDPYQYEITVYTGIGGDAGTSSNVTVLLCGDKLVTSSATIKKTLF